MYNDLMWWLLVITPTALSITCFIWRMEHRGAWNKYPQQQDDLNLRNRDEATASLIDADCVKPAQKHMI